MAKKSKLKNIDIIQVDSEINPNSVMQSSWEHESKVNKILLDMTTSGEVRKSKRITITTIITVWKK